MGGHIHPPRNSCWEGCSPFVLRRESKGSWAKIRGSQGVVWGGLGYMGKAWDPQQSLKIKNHLGTWEGWSGEKMLGPSELAPTVAPPSVVGVTPRQMTCDCTIRGRKPGSGTSSSYLTVDKSLVFLARTSPRKGPCSSKPVWNPVFPGPLLYAMGGGGPNSARSDCRGALLQGRAWKQGGDSREGEGVPLTCQHCSRLEASRALSSANRSSKTSPPTTQKGSQEPWVSIESCTPHLWSSFSPTRAQPDHGRGPAWAAPPD